MRGIPFILLRLFLCVLLACAVIIMVFALAQARDLDGRYAQSPNREWFQSLKSGKGPCCSDSDGQTVEPQDWLTQEKPKSHYRVFVQGEGWLDVPDDALLTEPNRVGRAILWPIWIDGKMQIRCFMPGTFG